MKNTATTQMGTLKKYSIKPNFGFTKLNNKIKNKYKLFLRSITYKNKVIV